MWLRGVACPAPMGSAAHPPTTLHQHLLASCVTLPLPHCLATPTPHTTPCGCNPSLPPSLQFQSWYLWRPRCYLAALGAGRVGRRDMQSILHAGNCHKPGSVHLLGCMACLCLMLPVLFLRRSGLSLSGANLACSGMGWSPWTKSYLLLPASGPHTTTL